jgi:ADP-heptose:LPS heptosyltransferase
MARYLIIRRDNIGDMVCTTPLLKALKSRFPDSTIDVLANSYNAAVLESNDDVDNLYIYTKAKHRTQGQSYLNTYYRRLQVILKLRKKKYDYVILAGSNYVPHALRFAKLLRPQKIVGYDPEGLGGLDIVVKQRSDHEERHEVDNTFYLLSALDITGPVPPLKLVISEQERARAAQIMVSHVPLRIAVNISTRKPSQRWPIEKFAEWIRRLQQQANVSFALFWSPGDSSNPTHPGDDANANLLLRQVSDLPVIPFPTSHLRQLIAGLEQCQIYVGSDGGALHLAAALSLPCLCFFGNSDPIHWRPWDVPYVALQPSSKHAADISVQEALEGYHRLQTRLLPASRPNTIMDHCKDMSAPLYTQT